MARQRLGEYNPKLIIGHTRTFDFPVKDPARPWVVIDRHGRDQAYATRAAMRRASPGGRRNGYVRIEYQRKLATAVRPPSVEWLERFERAGYGTREDRITALHIAASWRQALDRKDFTGAQRLRDAYFLVGDHASGFITTPEYARAMKAHYEWALEHGYVFAPDPGRMAEWLYFSHEA